MDRKNLLIASGLIGVIIVLVIGFFIIIPGIAEILIGGDSAHSNYPSERYITYFNNSTPETTAISVAKLNYGFSAFCSNGTASLTSDGKYWLVKLDNADIVTVDAKTWTSKRNGAFEPEPAYPTSTWRPLDELKALYIARIRSRDEIVGKPQKITMDGKEIWKVPIYKEIFGDINNYQGELLGYVYIDLATGKSKKEYEGISNKLYNAVFGDVSGMGGWLTLKEVDAKIGRSASFRDALRELYPE